MLLDQILENAFPDASGASRLQLVGLFTLIYVLQEDDTAVTARRLCQLTGQHESDIGRQVKKLLDLGLIDRTQILNIQGRGRAFKLTVKSNDRTKRLTKAIDKAAAPKQSTRQPRAASKGRGAK